MVVASVLKVTYYGTQLSTATSFIFLIIHDLYIDQYILHPFISVSETTHNVHRGSETEREQGADSFFLPQVLVAGS